MKTSRELAFKNRVVRNLSQCCLFVDAQKGSIIQTPDLETKLVLLGQQRLMLRKVEKKSMPTQTMQKEVPEPENTALSTVLLLIICPLFSDLNTPSGAKSLLQVTIDSELTCCEST
jgi:hypothetical protein